MGALPLGLLAAIKASSPSVAVLVWGPDGALDPEHGDQLSRLLVIEGLTVVVGLSADRHCLGDCAVIQIRHLSSDLSRGVIELTASSTAGVAKMTLHLPERISESDGDRAIALRVIALVDELQRRAAPRPREPRRQPPLQQTVEPQKQPAAAGPTADGATRSEDPAAEGPGPEPRKARDPLYPAPGSMAPVPPSIPKQEVGPRLDLSFGAGPSLVIPVADVAVTGGLEVSLAGALGPVGLRVGGSWLVTVLGDGLAGRFRYSQLPFFAVVTAQLPGLDFLRLGLGGELVAISLARLNAQLDVDDGVDLGIILHLELRVPFRRLRPALTTRLSFHPAPYRAQDDLGATIFSAPQFSVSVGLRADLVLADSGAETRE